jgi:long-subunit fatty acid transport protein
VEAAQAEAVQEVAVAEAAMVVEGSCCVSRFINLKNKAMKRLIIISIFIFSLTQAKAQTISDAYLLSNQKVNGTARASAMGNALGALGGDFTSLSINPAGIGIYRTSEFVLTPVIQSNSSDVTLGMNTYNDSKFQIKLNNIGFIGTIPVSKGNSGVVSFNYGLGCNNVLDFNQNFYVSNDKSTASFLDDIAAYANSEKLSNSYLNQKIGQVEYRDWPTKLAWDTYLINPALDENGNEVDGSYTSPLYTDETVNQQKSYSRSGGINEFVLSGGLNFNHKLYLGATFGFQDVDLRQTTEYSETFGENSYTYGEDFSLEGTGYNFKFGAIFKPTNSLRLGLAVHTPTYYVLKENKQIYIDSRLQENYSSDGINLYEYNLFSPWKTILSGAYIIGKRGLVSIDAEYLDYSTMKYRRSSGTSDNLSDVNTEITNGFNNALNIRIGGEFKVTPQFSLRGGYETYPNAQKEPTGSYYQPLALDNSSVYAFGVGYNSNKFFTDVTFRNTTNKYTLNEIQPNLQSMELKNNNSKILFTIGFKF